MKLVPDSICRLVADKWIVDGRCMDVRNVCTMFGRIEEQMHLPRCISILGQRIKLSQIADLPVQKYLQHITTSLPLVPALPKGASNSILTAHNQKFWNYGKLQVEIAKWSTSQSGPLSDPLL